jgi:hypothetical protein
VGSASAANARSSWMGLNSTIRLSIAARGCACQPPAVHDAVCVAAGCGRAAVRRSATARVALLLLAASETVLALACCARRVIAAEAPRQHPHPTSRNSTHAGGSSFWPGSRRGRQGRPALTWSCRGHRSWGSRST